jgi:carbon starvation protein CstA
VLPVWLLLAPRDYLSAFVKIGVVLALALGIVIVRRAEARRSGRIVTWRRGSSSAATIGSR